MTACAVRQKNLSADLLRILRDVIEAIQPDHGHIIRLGGMRLKCGRGNVRVGAACADDLRDVGRLAVGLGFFGDDREEKDESGRER